ncbi:hypothetical protein O181_037305 [Austropuccinia psidii MF-1]|uniref:Zn(2)-C6 fungal-type domain-containing protein n=1 Tax=Austropuccinia psidii MF-1 TaxID=1389203 RepID=A0A9Q3HD02_9BASI|nr:hypothetical protein [Austropuccinia psidii MF-1]
MSSNFPKSQQQQNQVASNSQNLIISPSNNSIINPIHSPSDLSFSSRSTSSPPSNSSPSNFYQPQLVTHHEQQQTINHQNQTNLKFQSLSISNSNIIHTSSPSSNINQSSSPSSPSFNFNPSSQSSSQINNQIQIQSKRRRYRIPRSCDRCRSSKVKCVYEDGRCAACTAAGVACTFANPGSLKERPPTQKDVEHLQARIRSLERLIRAISPNFDLDNLPNLNHLQSRSNFQTSLPTSSIINPSSPSSTSTSVNHQLPIPNLLNSNQDQPTINPSQSNPPIPSTILKPQWHPTGPDPATSKSTFRGLTFESNHYIGTNALFSIPDSTNTKADAILATHSSTNNSSELSPVDKIIRIKHEQRAYSTHHFYPEPDLEKELIRLYFTHLHSFIPILHPTTFHQLHESGLAHTDTTFRALCLFLFALASRFSTDPRARLDLEGNPHPSPQIAGLRFCFSGFLYFTRPIVSPATLYDLQALVLLCIYCLGTFSLMSTWSLVGSGLQRAQECGAHREHSRNWTTSPLQDYLRRKAFFALYDLDHGLSATLGRAAYMQEEDFDLVPIDCENSVNMGTFINPFMVSNSEAHQAFLDYEAACSSMMSSLSGFRSLLPVLNQMRAQSRSAEAASLIPSIKALIDEIEHGTIQWYEQLPAFLKQCSLESSSLHLLCTVNIQTWYHHFRLMVNRTLFNDITHSNDLDGSFKNPYFMACIQSAKQIIQHVNKLRLRKLLEHGFFWIPMRITTSGILLICALKKQQGRLDKTEVDDRRQTIQLAIDILNDLAPSTHLAEFTLVALKKLYSMLDFNDPKLLVGFTSESLLHSKITSVPESQTNEEGEREKSLDPFELSTSLYCDPSSNQLKISSLLQLSR